MNWLQEQGIDYLSTGVVVGDVLCCNSRYGNTTTYTKVVSTTKTIAKCEDGTVWMLRTGKMRGDVNWDRPYAYVVRDMAKVNALSAERNAVEADQRQRRTLAAELPDLVRDFTKDELLSLVALTDQIKQRKAVSFMVDHFAGWARSY